MISQVRKAIDCFSLDGTRGKHFWAVFGERDMYIRVSCEVAKRGGRLHIFCHTREEFPFHECSNLYSQSSLFSWPELT